MMINLIPVNKQIKCIFICFKAWDDTFRNWEVITQYLETYPKDPKVKAEDSTQAGSLSDSIRLSKRKPPHHANTVHELEVSYMVVKM